MELTAEVIKRYHLEQAQAETLEEKQELFLRMVRNHKDFAILQHRKMWIWIAQQYAKGRKTKVANLKREYIKEYCFNANVLNHCFCCEHLGSEEGWSLCLKCPILWKDGYYNDNSESTVLLDRVCYYTDILCRYGIYNI